MRGYSEVEAFTAEDLELWRNATRLVDAVDERYFPELRCHELARAVGIILDRPVQDGFYGFADHSWLWTRALERTVGRIGFPNVLDVYCCGAMPPVRLADGSCTALPHIGWAYRPGPERADIQHDVVTRLVCVFKSVL